MDDLYHDESTPGPLLGTTGSTASTRTGAMTDNRLGPLLLVLLVALLINAPRLQDELRFFHGPALVAADGSAPVLQDDQASPAIDNAFLAAARLLPPGAICVIARDSWNRDYFRASYLLMPRQVWPVAALLADSLPTTTQIADALHAHGAGCVLAPAATAVPRGMLSVWRGAYDVYRLPTGAPLSSVTRSSPWSRS